ncbi:MAG: NAD(P)-binding protein [Actinomycetota bacterium]
MAVTRLTVVGGGLAGLIAANTALDETERTGADRLELRLIERSAGAEGGRARTTRHEAYRFNQGPHALYLDGELMAALQRFGIDPTGGAPRSRGFRALRRGEIERLPAGPVGLATTGLLGLRGRLQIGRLLAGLARRDPAEGRGRTATEWVEAAATDPDARALLHAIVRLATYANAPHLACAEATIAQLKRALDPGVRYVDGGWGTIVAALHARLEERGVAVEHRTVTSIDDVLADVDRVAVAVGGPEATAALTGVAVDRGAVGPPVEAAVYEVGARTEPECSVLLGIDDPLYGSQHGPPADLAPPGHSVMAAARYLAPDESHDRTSTMHELQRHVRLMGITSADVVADRYLHRMTVANGMPLAHPDGGLRRRPPVEVPGRPEVAIAGDWVGPHGMLADTSAASATEAARRLLTGGDMRVA